MPEKKWGRAKEIICDLFEKFNEVNNFPEINLKDMEQKTGFLVHLTMVYPLIIPFLRGLYLAMNYWRPKRDRDGCKLSKRLYGSFIKSGMRQGHIGYSSGHREEDKALKMVNVVGRLFKQLSALSELFKEYEPDLMLI